MSADGSTERSEIFRTVLGNVALTIGWSLFDRPQLIVAPPPPGHPPTRRPAIPLQAQARMPGAGGAAVTSPRAGDHIER